MENVVNMSAYFRDLKRCLDCPKDIRSHFLTKTRQTAEDFLRSRPDTVQQDLEDYLGEPQELAQGFLETLDPDLLERYRKRKKFLLRGCIAVVIIALIGAVTWSIFLWSRPMNVEVKGVITVYE